MIKVEVFMTIWVLHQQGASVREIARRLSVSRNTVRRYLRGGEEMPRYQRRSGRPSKLDGVRGYLERRIDQALPHRLPATVLFREAQALGYTGGERILRQLVSSRYAKAPAEPVVRYETEPGEQMQVDWAVIRRGSAALSAFVAVLGYSRSTYVEIVDNERIESLLGCQSRALAHFGGVPRKVLYDNMKTVVIRSNSPSTRESMNRPRHLATVAPVVSSSRATDELGSPPAHSNTTRARNAMACGVVRARINRSSSACSSAETTSSVFLGAPRSHYDLQRERPS